MSDIQGITESEAKLLKSVLLFIRNLKPFEVLELKLNDNELGKVSVLLKTNHKEVFNIDNKQQ